MNGVIKSHSNVKFYLLEQADVQIKHHIQNIKGLVKVVHLRKNAYYSHWLVL